ncbi:LysE family translocator [Paraburkholderia sp. D15]|uniref:LysE family translocator n=1 Tax=Paraburkholderia sp. D15 TaxID=2880218 RepID=UPI00247A9F90|nr:LysE family translocator [Paraburkholderia sp. D15]WGS48393.1 LysE family translocator [Paraburkholderia sp. D15]WKF56273.1 Threonine efflux protein [Paraburkholderia busanensis]
MIDLYFLGKGLTGLIITCIVLIAIPGPSIMFLVGQAISSGRNTALRGVLGNALGTYAVAVVLAAGIGTVLAQSGFFVVLARFIGAIVLAWIGFMYIRPKAPLKVGIHPATGPGGKMRRASFLSGFIVGATNPKALVIFGAILPGFIPDADNPVGTLLAYSLVPVGLGIVIDSIWVWVAHAVSSRARTLNERKIHVAGGCLMILMALLLIKEAVSSA